MKVNEGTADRVIRVIVGIILIAVSYFVLDLKSGSIGGIIAVIIGAVALITGLVGVCPAYMCIGLKTCPTKNPPSEQQSNN